MHRAAGTLQPWFDTSGIWLREQREIFTPIGERRRDSNGRGLMAQEVSPLLRCSRASEILARRRAHGRHDPQAE